MRKKIILRTSWLVIMVALLVGCVKDKGNYKMHKIPKLTSNGFTILVNGKQVVINNTDNILINANDQLKIVINDELAKDVEPDYRWCIYEIDPLIKPGNLPDPAVEIATTKDFDQKINNGPGKYKLSRKVTNKKNGDASFDEFTIEIEAISGLLVYYKDEHENADYGAIRTMEMGLGLPAEKMGVNKNVYSNINKGHTLAKPSHLWLRKINDPNYPNEILAASENGLTFINYRTNIYEHNNYNAIFTFPLSSNPAPQGHMNGSNKTEYLVQHGELYYINYMTASEIPKFVQLSDPGINYSQHMMTIPTSTQPFRLYTNVVFNQTSQRFEYEEAGTLIPFIATPGPMGALDVDLSATQMDLVYMAKGKDNTINAIMKNAQGHLHYLVFDITDPSASICIQNIDLSALNAVTDNGLWAIAERGPFAFFTKDNTIYTLNHEKGTVGTALDNIPAGAQITVLSILKDSENASYDNAILYIAYNQGNEGTVLQYEFNPISGKLKAESKPAFTGFGKITDIVLKK